MPRPMGQDRAAKRTLSRTDLENSDHEEQSVRGSPVDVDEVGQRGDEVQLSATRHEPTPKPNDHAKNRQVTRKRQKVEQPPTIPESDFVEIEYVNQLRYNFSPKNGLAGDLPPIHDLKQIFEQITLHAVHENGFKEFLKSLNGRQLRVATVCSGTESPILALEMVVSSLKKMNIGPFAFKHVFSAEIVEYKQAYIARNFRPPLLFRDAIELHREFAHTAYGARKKVPTRPDLLIAGFPCVDYSNLNNWRKKFGERGESNDTLRGLVAYCEIHRPKIIILENITNAPWTAIGRAFEKVGYHFRNVKVDTKDFYLPQTRERGYALCIEKSLVENGGALLDQWVSVFSGFERRASSPFTEFIDADDDVIEQRKLERPPLSEPRSSPVWSLYKIRHADVRRATTFGNGRPITHWEEDGKCCPATWMDRPWFFSQVERVWDTIDVNHLRTLSVGGYDNTSKIRCIDVSQGVDRDMDTKPFGIMSCITPCGMLYSTARGGQIQGRELLSMQGLPMDRLSLTRESQSQMQDLAGNAMSTTVVGPAMISALIICHSVLKAESEEQVMETEDNIEESMPTVALTSSYLKSMRTVTSWDKTKVNWLGYLQAFAGLATSLCSCEGPYGIGQYGLYRCIDCGFTACAACKVNPIHNYRPIPVVQLRTRKDPKVFREMLLYSLPALLQPPQLPIHLYQTMSGQYSTSTDTDIGKIWKQYLETVILVCQDTLMFKSIKRRHIWTVVYDGAHSTLQLTIDAHGMHWKLFAKAPDVEPARSYFREVVRHPIAKMEVDRQGSSLLEGEWQIYGPLSRKDKMITLQGVGDQLPSYESICGLPDLAHKKVSSAIIVGGEDEVMKGLSFDVRGRYERLPNCGGALQSLHRRVEENKPNLFLFLDPRILGPSQLDSWVFSMDPHRKTDDSQRDIVLQLDCKWTYQDLQRSGPTFALASRRRCIDAGIMSLIDCDSKNGFTSRILSSQVTLQLNSDSCYDCYLPLLSISVDVKDTLREQFPWTVVEKSNFQGKKNLSWAWTRFSTRSPCKNWKSIDVNFEICERCFPEQPRMAWAILRGKERPIEDPEDAARSERDYKLRPSPFCLFERLDHPKDEESKQRRHNCVALNVKTLFHRACGAIAHRRDDSTAVEFYWRITSNDDTDIPRPGSYRFLNNNQEPGAAQPPHFKILLRSDQLRSFRWVLSRESNEQAGFPEEEVEEAILGPLNWRAEAKVIVHRKIRGGVLADHVGFGKTAVILGLIDYQHEKDVFEAGEPCDNAIPLKATCIVVPDILFDQWRGEMVRFLGDQYTVLGIDSIHVLESTPVKAFQSADIVLVSWTTFTGTVYFKKLEKVAGGPCPPKMNSSVRMFEAWSKDVLDSIETQVRELQNGGPEAFLEAIRRKQNSVWGTDAYNRYLPSRKLARKKVGKLNPDEDPLAASQAHGDMLDGSVSHSSSSLTNNKSTNISPKKETQTPNESNQNEMLYNSAFGIAKNRQTPMEDVRNTVFHMYRFQRLVIDEFTYLNQDRHALLTSLKARSRWIMSGTPPIKGFASAERMARLLNVYLGKPSDEDFEKSKYKRSESENFHFFSEAPSRGWNFRRNGLAQHFCDVFMRQNTPDIPPIKWTVHYHPTVLSAVERVLYLELKLFYESYNPNTTGEKREKYSHDQRGRVSEIVDSCDTPEQSLIKRSSVYDALPKWSSATERIDTASKILKHRRNETVKVLNELTIQAKAIAWLLHQLGQNNPRFDALKASLETNDYGDSDVSNRAQGIIDEALGSYRNDDWKEFWYLSNGSPVKIASAVTDIDGGETDADEEAVDEEQAGREDQVVTNSEHVPLSQRNKQTIQPKTNLRLLPSDTSETEKELREWTNRFRVSVLALVERMRASRFVQSAYTFQDRSIIPDCQSCGLEDPRSRKEHSVLGKCGHTVCKDCLEDILINNKCTVGDCRAAVDKRYVIPGPHFAMCRTLNMPTPPGGTKVEALVKLLKDEMSIPKEDQVILFLQFPDLEQTVTAVLQLHSISYVSVGMTGRRGRNRIKTFADHDKKVAILQLGTENAAGLNLQNANHVIFFAPFAAKNHYEYQSTITQSSGRVIRFGQKKEVHIWNLVTLNTLEVGILQEQEGRVLVRRVNGRYELVLEDEVRVDDVKGFEVPVFDWK